MKRDNTTSTLSEIVETTLRQFHSPLKVIVNSAADELIVYGGPWPVPISMRELERRPTNELKIDYIGQRLLQAGLKRHGQ